MALNAPYTPNTVIQSTQVSNDLLGLADGSNDVTANKLATFRDEAFFDFVVSGLVLTGDSYGVNRNASMSSGVIVVDGLRVAISAVSARTYTASKDTYVDITSGGTVVYTETSNNAASPALASGSIRIGIVVTGATTIANVGSINQGQIGKLLPISGVYPYAVNDSLGNRICSRTPTPLQLGILYHAGTTLTTSYVTHAQVIAKSHGGDVKVNWGCQAGNGNSGADRNFNTQILCDGVAITPVLNFDSPYIAGTTTNLQYGYTYYSSPAAGAHTWALQFQGSVAGAVLVVNNFIEVIEVL